MAHAQKKRGTDALLCVFIGIQQGKEIAASA